MMKKTSLLSGLEAYGHHDYLTALKHFTAPTSSSQLHTLVTQTLAAITNLQLCNYNEAALTLGQIKAVLDQHERQGGTLTGELELLKIKVMTNFLVLELLNCQGERMEEVLAELLSCLEGCQEKDEDRGFAMFRVIMKSLFGYQSFRKIEQECQEVSKKLIKTTAPSKSTKVNNTSKISISPVLLSAFSLYHHLTGNTTQSLIFQQAAYSLSKDHQIIPSLLSLRHLQELSRQLNDSKSTRQYRNQLLLLMTHEQLQGVAEQTLFRNYNKKIELATKVVGTLIQYQKQYQPYRVVYQFDRYAIVWKLKNVRKSENNPQIGTILELIESNQDVLKIMAENEFAKEAKKQYRETVEGLSSIVLKVMKGKWFSKVIAEVREWARMKDVQEQQQMQEISEEDSRIMFSQLTHLNTKQPKEQQQQQPIHAPSRQSPPNNSSPPANSPYLPQTRSHRKRQPYATSFYLPKPSSPHHEIPLNSSREKSFSNDKSQTNLTTRQGMKNRVYTVGSSNISAGSSRIKQRPVKQSEVKEQIQAQSSQSRVNNIYKIAKEQHATQKKVESSKVEYSNKSYMVGRTQEPFIEQFIRQPEEVVMENREEQRSPSPEAPKRPDRTAYQPPFSRGQNLQRISQESISNRQTLIRNEPTHSQMIRSQATKFKPENYPSSVVVPQTYASSIPLSKQSQPALQPQHSAVTQIAIHLKSKRAETVYQINLSKQKINQKLRRMISLCQSGQYLQKRHFSSDGGAQRFLMLNKSRDRLYWGDSQTDIDISGDRCSYKMEDIRGIVYGKVTQTMRKQCNYKLEAWKCFSLILKKRTFDVYLPQERDLFFWLPGLSLCLRQLNYTSPLYDLELNYHSKVEKPRPANLITFNNKQVERFYSMGRVLWRRFLMKIKHEYVHVKKHEKVRKFSNENAYAVVVAAVSKMGYKPTVMKKAIIL